MAKQKRSAAEEALRHARELRPDVWERTDQVARIIDPSAFMDGWITESRPTSDLLMTRLKYKQANAMARAQEILNYLGVNTDSDWAEILTRIARSA